MQRRSRVIPPNEWKAIPCFEGLYEVSRCGLIRSLTVTRDHGGYRPREIPGRLIQGKKHYGSVTLWPLDGPPTYMGRHVAVARAWIPNPHNLPLVRHLDDDKENHHVSNLAWGTTKDNMLDACLNGRRGKVLDAAKVRQIKKELTENARRLMQRSDGGLDRWLAKQFNVSESTIGRIRNGKAWHHVTGY